MHFLFNFLHISDEQSEEEGQIPFSTCNDFIQVNGNIPLYIAPGSTSVHLNTTMPSSF